jgi:type IV secretion system protein VirB2
MIRTLSRGCRTMATAAATVSISMMLAPAAHASGSSMPWEAPLQSILESIEGPVAKIIAVIVIIATGLALGRRLITQRTTASRQPV